ncbi:MAG: tagaturonate reductase, partial [Flavobacterium sp.]
LEIAKSKDLEIIVSNTTEVGIQLVHESINQNPPVSFPAKVLAVLHERYQSLGSTAAGLVIIATELIPENGTKLGSIVLELANYNKLSADFIAWLQSENRFCNSLVDRIVPGKPDAANLAKLQEELGYEDQLLSMSEPYNLWAIEGDAKVAEVLSFAKIDEGVVIAEDIEIYRELKVRLLNGTHTLTSGIAYLSGISLVKDAMQNEEVKAYIDNLMANEIAPAIPYQVTEDKTTKFASTVKDRFANPSIEHLWLNITFQYSMKMKIRILPLLLNHYKLFNSVPENIAFGFAAYLTFMNVANEKDGKFCGSYQGNPYLITDDSASYFKEIAEENYPSAVLQDADFWKADLTLLPGFTDAVIEKYNLIAEKGIVSALTTQNSTQLI